MGQTTLTLRSWEDLRTDTDAGEVSGLWVHTTDRSLLRAAIETHNPSHLDFNMLGPNLELDPAVLENSRVSSLALCAPFRHAAALFSGLTTIRVLELQSWGCNITDEDLAQYVNACPALESLCLGSSAVSTAALADALVALPHLQDLKLSHCKGIDSSWCELPSSVEVALRSLSIAWLPGCYTETLLRIAPSLKDLKLNNVEVVDGLIGRLLKASGIERFSCNDVRGVSGPDLATLQFSDVKTLHLDGAFAESGTFEAFSLSPLLTELSLTGEAWTDARLARVLVHTPNLRSVNLTGGSVGVRCAELLHPMRIERMNMNGTKLPSEVFDILLKEPRHDLKLFHVEGCWNLRDAEAEKVAAGQALEDVNFSETQVDGSWGKALACPWRVRNLNMRDCEFAESRNLRWISDCVELRELHLSGCDGVDPTIAEDLAKLPLLEQAWLPFSRSTVAPDTFRPSTKVIFDRE